MSASSILTDQFLPQINKALEDIDTAEKEIELARRAGLMEGQTGAELRQSEDKMKAAKERLLSIKQVYFPGQ